ncbi:MAG TPA: tetratricopeptide repeat protein [Verrucomicrobiota bacterium]|jgi:tetratricopeptide (TPR) repeat protein|nr:MAG: Tetratricopeptide repeat protein [Verrucomicrobia bacterium ADurb.Bin118]HPY30522.1 tetratricopeptide repeat protein [Verrucomicrobiota bacterium]HQB15686.1 tetratricopeptide repeat protein [Verrucomicrobiota bacterium]
MNNAQFGIFQFADSTGPGPRVAGLVPDRGGQRHDIPVLTEQIVEAPNSSASPHSAIPVESWSATSSFSQQATRASRNSIRRSRTGQLFAAVAGLLLTSALMVFAQSDLPAPAEPETTNSHEMLRAYLQVQEQLHATQLAIERNRQETEAAAARHAEALTRQMQKLEQALATEQQRTLDAWQRMHRLMLTFAAIFAGVGLLGGLAIAWMQTRVAGRLTQLGPGGSLPPALGVNPNFPALGPGTGSPGPLDVTESANARLLSVIEKLEKRIQQFEQLPPSAAPRVTPAESPVLAPAPLPPPAEDAEQKAADHRAAQIELLLGKGQVLLDLQRPEEALTCIEAALKLDPQHPEAMVRKGLALEQTQQPEAALACYDRAIAADETFTMAYLHKGGLCNRLARHQDALQCYELALKTQEQQAAAAGEEKL